MNTYFGVGISQCIKGKESACQSRRCRFDPWVWKIPWRRKWLLTPVFFPGKSHGQSSPVNCSPCCCRVGQDWVAEYSSMNTYFTANNLLGIVYQVHALRKYVLNAYCMPSILKVLRCSLHGIVGERHGQINKIHRISVGLKHCGGKLNWKKVQECVWVWTFRECQQVTTEKVAFEPKPKEVRRPLEWSGSNCRSLRRSVPGCYEVRGVSDWGDVGEREVRKWGKWVR